MEYNYWNKRNRNILKNKPEVDDLSLSFYSGAPIWFNRLVAWNKDKCLSKLLHPILPINDLKILDIGCGSGRYIKLLSDLGGNVTGIDISQDIIKRCKKNFPSNSFYDVSILEIDSSLDNFDLIISSTILQHIKDEEKAFKNIFNLMKNGGSLLIIENQLDRSNHIHGISYKRWIELGENVGLCPKIIIPSDHRCLITIIFKIINIINAITDINWWRKKIFNKSINKSKSHLKNIYNKNTTKGKIFLHILHIAVIISYMLEPLFKIILPISYARHIGILFLKK